MSSVLRALLLAALSAATVSFPAHAVQRYIAVPLGTLGGNLAAGFGINSRGDVVGVSRLADNQTQRAFMYSGAQMRDLGTLGGTHSAAFAVNSSGEVTGGAQVNSWRTHVFRFSDGVMHDLGSNLGLNAVGYGINDQGDVTGGSAYDDFWYDGEPGFVVSGDKMRTLAASQGTAINASGQVAGRGLSTDPLQWGRAVLISGDEVSVVGGLQSIANGINAKGAMTGWADTTDGRHAFVYSGGTWTDLRTLGGTLSAGYALNVGGKVVGVSSVAGSMEWRAFVYSDGIMVDLNDLVVSGLEGAPLASAFAINDSGQIVANTCYSGTVCKAYRLDPLAGPPIALAVEYHHITLDHYFLTNVEAEIAMLDAGVTVKGWTRTGQAFLVYPVAQTGTTPVCRIRIPPDKGDSHFYGRGSEECAATMMANPSLINEGTEFFHVFLPVQGVCPAATRPVFRVFSARPDANHRYMVQPAIRDQMVDRGWIAEGDGPDRVVMCSPTGV